MTKSVLVMLLALNTGAAFAHTSLVPHDHPHATSLLPDSAALVLAALLVGAGVIALHRMRKE